MICWSLSSSRFGTVTVSSPIVDVVLVVPDGGASVSPDVVVAVDAAVVAAGENEECRTAGLIIVLELKSRYPNWSDVVVVELVEDATRWDRDETNEGTDGILFFDTLF